MSVARPRTQQHTVAWGVGLSVVLLAAAVAIPWKGARAPASLTWLWIPLVVGVVVVNVATRHFVAWAAVGAVVLVVALSWTVPTRLAPIVITYVAGLELGATAQVLITRRAS